MTIRHDLKTPLPTLGHLLPQGEKAITPKCPLLITNKQSQDCHSDNQARCQPGRIGGDLA